MLSDYVRERIAMLARRAHQQDALDVVGRLGLHDHAPGAVGRGPHIDGMRVNSRCLLRP